MTIQVKDASGAPQTIDTVDDLVSMVATQATLSAADTKLGTLVSQTVAIGAKADAKSTATDTTAISAMSVWKQISASIQAAAASLAGTLNIGLPTGASTSANQSTGNTSLSSIDGKQTTINTGITSLNTVFGTRTDPKSTATDGTSASIMQILKQISASLQGSSTDIFGEYEVVPASTTQVLGTTGVAGDYLSSIWIHPATAGCGTVVVKDGATTIYTFPGGGTTPLPTLAPIPWMPGIYASGAGFSIVTGANVSVMGIGNFT